MNCCINLTKKAKTIAKAGKKLVLNQNAELAQQRRKVCNACENNVAGVCSICKCIIRLKVREETENCPVNKW
jgi:hypothetical protein